MMNCLPPEHRAEHEANGQHEPPAAGARKQYCRKKGCDDRYEQVELKTVLMPDTAVPGGSRIGYFGLCSSPVKASASDSSSKSW